MGVRLCSVDSLKTYLNIPSTETAFDADFAKTIDEASSECETYCSNKFTYQSYANEPHPGDGNLAVTNNRPMDPNAALQVKSGSDPNTQTIFDTTQYTVDYVAGIIQLLDGLRFDRQPNGALLSYSAGYNAAGVGVGAALPDGTTTGFYIGIPDDLTRSVRDLAAALRRYQDGILALKDLNDIRDHVHKVWGRYRNR